MMYCWKCLGCELTTEVQRPIQDRALPPDEPCTECTGTDWQRVYESPMVMHVALPDGTKRKGWAEVRESANLQKQAAVEKNKSTKADLLKEARKVRELKK